MYESAIPVEFKSLLDPAWKQQQEERLLARIKQELEIGDTSLNPFSKGYKIG